MNNIKNIDLEDKKRENKEIKNNETKNRKIRLNIFSPFFFLGFGEGL